MDYIKSIYQLPKNDKAILSYESNAKFSIYPNDSLFKYGFYYYINQTKNKMSILETPEFKDKNLHYVVNEFEPRIQEYVYNKNIDQNNKIDIYNASLKYFDIKDESDMKYIDFYAYWEMLMILNIISDKTSPLNILNLCNKENLGAKMAIKFYLDKFTNTKNANKFDIISLEDIIDNKNIFDIDKIKKLLNNKTSYNIITADIELKWHNLNNQEQESYILLLIDIYFAMNQLNKGGCFILKIYDSFTDLTIKIISILNDVFENVFIIKPFVSRPSNSEKFLVCMNYLAVDKNKLNKLLDIITKANNNGKYLVDIFPDYIIPESLELLNIITSVKFSNNQHKYINTMVNYLNSYNFYGDIYNELLDKQKKANNYWISTFYPINKDDLITMRNYYEKEIKNAIKKSIDDLVNYQKIYISQKYIYEFNKNLNNYNDPNNKSVDSIDTSDTNESEKNNKKTSKKASKKN